MKKSDYISISIFVMLIIIGIYFGKFLGGMLAGAGIVLLIVVTIGKVVYIKSAAKIDAQTEALRKAMNAARNPES